MAILRPVPGKLLSPELRVHDQLDEKPRRTRAVLNRMLRARHTDDDGSHPWCKRMLDSGNGQAHSAPKHSDNMELFLNRGA